MKIKKKIKATKTRPKFPIMTSHLKVKIRKSIKPQFKDH